MNTLKRGYAIVKKDDMVVASISKLKEKDDIKINLSDGVIDAKIIKVGE